MEPAGSCLVAASPVEPGPSPGISSAPPCGDDARVRPARDVSSPPGRGPAAARPTRPAEAAPPCRQPACPDLPVRRSMHYGKSTEGIWSLLNRSMANFAADLDGAGPHRQAQAEEDPVPAPPDRGLPGRHRTNHRSLVITCSTSSTWLATHA